MLTVPGGRSAASESRASTAADYPTGWKGPNDFRPVGADDRVPDAANGIRTTAVRSPILAGNVLIVLSLLVFLTLRAPLGAAGALTAFTPLALFFAVRNPGTAWLLTKAYFGVVWLYLLGLPGAAG